MTYLHLIDNLLQTIPEIEQSYINELDWWDGEPPGAHIVFGDILNPLLIEKLKMNDDIDLLKRIFDFFELMALSDDEKVKEVLACTVLERLGDDKFILQQAEYFMKKSTMQMSYNLEKGLGRL